MAEILLVEDNIDIQKINKWNLETNGHNTRLAMNLTEAREALSKHTTDLIILDIELPDGNGLDFLAELREKQNTVPVLLVTARSSTDDLVKGMTLGGDDYISKPYENMEFLARVQGLLRRAKQTPDIKSYGRLTVNNITHRVTLDSEDLNLKPKEFQLLVYFLKNMERLLTAEEIYEAVWGMETAKNIDTVKVRINGLREKIKMNEGVVIETVERKFYVCKLL